MDPAFVLLSAVLAGGTTAVLKVPAAPPPKPVTALVVLGGFEAGARVIEPIEPREPVVLATFEYPYRAPHGAKAARILLDGPKMKRAIKTTSASIRALSDYLRRRPDVDPERVCVVGVSFAAPLAIHAAAEDPSVSCLVVVEGFADVSGTAQARLAQQWRRRLTPVLAWPLAYFAARPAIAYLDPPRPEEDAPKLRATQRVLVVDAQADTLIPERSRRLLARALARSRARVERRSVPGDHLRGVSDPRIPELVSVVERWLDSWQAAR